MSIGHDKTHSLLLNKNTSVIHLEHWVTKGPVHLKQRELQISHSHVAKLLKYPSYGQLVLHSFDDNK